MDEAAAAKIVEETKAKIDALEKEIEGLSGKDNKKARNEKSKEVSNIKNDKDYIDATRVVAGKEPLQEKNKLNAEALREAKEAEEKAKAEAEAKAKAEEEAAVAAAAAKAAKAPGKEKKQESTGISKAERDEL